jgi:adenosylhomocysteinase
VCASNPLSTQDDVAAFLANQEHIHVYAIHGANHEDYYSHIHATLASSPTITMDDGADLVTTLLTDARYKDVRVLGGTEETTTGVIRLRSMVADKVLRYPIIAINDADTKHLFDNRYGTGQSTMDGFVRATNRLFAGSNFVIAGYGWCGRGLALRASGMGAKVIITEIDPIKAIEAAMDGYSVMTMSEAAALGDFFCTVTGNTSVLRQEHFEKMKDGAIMANSGHFNVEIDLDSLKTMASKVSRIREHVDQYQLKDGRILNVLAEGRLLNLAAAEGHPAQVMDMSFSDQALAVEYLCNEADKLEKKVYTLPRHLDIQVAALKLASMGIDIDKLTPKQVQYLASWREGT